MKLVSQLTDELCERAAEEFTDAYEVSPEHPDDYRLRIDFGNQLHRLIGVAIAETHDDFQERAKAMAEERPAT